MTWNKCLSKEIACFLKEFVLLYSIISIVCASCLHYSFQGTNLADEIESIKVSYFQNFSGNGPASLGQDFTQALQEFYQRNTKLNVVSEGETDMVVEGEITGYEISPLSPGASQSDNQFDLATKTLLTITINVNFTNNFNEEDSFEKSFSFKQEFDSSQTLEQVEDRLVAEINENLIQMVYDATVSNW